MTFLPKPFKKINGTCAYKVLHEFLTIFSDAALIIYAQIRGFEHILFLLTPSEAHLDGSRPQDVVICTVVLISEKVDVTICQ